MLLIGMDRIKDRDRRVAAYDDAAGVTAAFNLNLITRINRELAGDLPLDGFVHPAIWTDAKARIEMSLEAVRPLHSHVAGQCFRMVQGERLHPESTHTYGPEQKSGAWGRSVTVRVIIEV